MPLGQRLTQMAPEGRGRIRDLGGELRVGAGNVLSEVKARKVRAPAFAACVGDLTEDAGEFVQGVSSTPDGLGRRLKLTNRDVVKGGDCPVQMLVDEIAHSSMPSSRLRLAGESSALDSSMRISRSSCASFPFA